MSTPGHIGWFKDIGLSDRPDVGGKGGSLGELQRAGIAVPPGFVVKTSAFERFIGSLEQELPFRMRAQDLAADDLSAITRYSATVRERIENAPVPDEVTAELTAAYAALCGAGGQFPVAVRSSATTEDAVDASFAGLQDTFLWVTGLAQTLQKLRSCWGSLYSVESLSYRRRYGMPESGVAMAVVIQKMVDARSAGVLFTRSPLTGDRSVMAIEGAWGLGSAVVGGEVTPDRWVLGKITGEISVRDISDKQIQHRPIVAGGTQVLPVEAAQRRAACMSDEELQALRTLGRRAEKHYGRAQDIEWAVDRHTAQILLLQSRPETVWSSKDPVPVARPADDPLKHVMSIFGGRR